MQVLGDRTYVLIPAEAPLPAVGKQVRACALVHVQPQPCKGFAGLAL